MSEEKDLTQKDLGLINEALAKKIDITPSLIQFINKAILLSTNDKEAFLRAYEMLIAYLIVNAPEQEKITAEAIPGHTVVEASNNIVQFSRATQNTPKPSNPKHS
jgi:hypothetical protein